MWEADEIRQAPKDPILVQVKTCTSQNLDDPIQESVAFRSKS